MDAKKRTDRPDWEDVHSFLVLSQSGSFAAAARELGLTHSTVARRIASLEASLGVPLIDRRGTSITLTPAGERTIAAAQEMAISASAIDRLTAGPADAVSGIVRITATEIFGSYFLMTRVRPLMEQYPGLEVEIIIDNTNLSLARRDADLAIRHGRPEGATLISRKIADYAIDFYADRSYLEAHRDAPYDFLGYTDDVANLPEALHTARAAGNQRPTLSLNTLPARLAATRAGLGIGTVPRYIAAQYPDLVRVDLGIEPLIRELWLVAHPDVREILRIRACFDFLVDAFKGARHILV